MNPYLLIIAISSVIILSFFFNIISKKTNIPSVLMLIVLGIVIKLIMNMTELRDKDLGIDSLLEVLGNIGLVMIVLEAALDLKLERSKAKLLLQSFIVASVSLGGSILIIASLFYYIFPGSDYYTCSIYAVPLSIMSSAIIIPSVGGLKGEKKEFMVYDSTFSDILGIMVFYFMLGEEGTVGGTSFGGIVSNLGITIIMSIVVAYGLVYIFQHLKMQVKLFLIIGVLMLMFALGKYFHLSSLLTILAFGLVLNNTDIFFAGRLTKYFDKASVKPILHDFHNLTLESAFLIRTFFFVLFGISITLTSLYDWRVAVNGVVIVLILYGVRFVALRFIAPKHVFPELYIAPRGLITVLLFFVILKDERINIPGFDAGLLLYPILITSIVMTVGLITHQGEKVADVLFNRLPNVNSGSEGEDMNEIYKKRIEENVEQRDFDGF
jgi:NhaP-type Na+/H+ or K+/H+ antiporter|tara:strand:- start:1793 stop:3106 length:1314 start_codon:yes stop_codon:yes gene_type:complete